MSILEWLKTLPNGVKEQAIRNYVLYAEADTKTQPESLSDAIKCAFDFTDTDEGFPYWDSICKNMAA